MIIFPKVTCGDRDCDGRPCQDEQTTPEPGDFTCPSKSGYFADPANCVNFYICDEWRPQSMNCPVGKKNEMVFLSTMCIQYL